MFSVVVPLFNKSHTVERCIGSILKQSFQDFEIVVVDDGSTDGSAARVKELSDDSRIRILEQPNQGVSVARNNGVRASTRPYIAFLDADDEWQPDFLRTIFRAIEEHPDAVMFGSSSRHQDWNTREGRDSTLGRYAGKIVEVEYFENPHTMPHTSAMVVSRKFFMEIFPDGNGFPPGMKCCEDWSCFQRLALKARFVYVGLPLGIRNNNVAGQITGMSEDKKRELLRYDAEYFTLLADAGETCGNSPYRRFFLYALRGKILHLLSERDPRALEHFLEHLGQPAKRRLGGLELACYRNPSVKLIAKIWIYLTKVCWRSHGYPVVGKDW